MSGFVALLRLELADAIRSRWAMFAAAVYCGLFALFVVLGLRESSVLGFTGISRALLGVASAIVLAVPLLALIATSQSVVRGRTQGLFELLLTQPVARSTWFAALVTSRLLVVLAPLVLLFLGAIVVSGFMPAAQSTVGDALRALAVTLVLGSCSVLAGVTISTFAKSAERAIVMVLLVWFASAALHDFALVGVLLRWHLPPHTVFALAAANPVELARLGLLAGIDPELSIFGPVGFWIAHVLGHGGLLAAAVAWPVAVACALYAMASHRFARGDLVA